MAIATTTLSAAIGATDTQFGLASTTGITAGVSTTGAGLTYLYVEAEMMLVTSVPVSGVVTVSRGQLGTVATTHAASVPVVAGAPTDFPQFTPQIKGFQTEEQLRYLGVSAPVAAAATLVPSGAIFHVTGTTATGTISLPSNFVEGQFTVIADAIWTWTSGT